MQCFVEFTIQAKLQLEFGKCSSWYDSIASAQALPFYQALKVLGFRPNQDNESTDQELSLTLWNE